MKLAKNDVRAVASEDFRSSLLHAAHFIGIAEHEFTCFEWLLFGLCSGNAAAFDRRMPDSIAVAERLFFVRQRVAVLPPHGFNSGHLPVSLPSSFKRRLEPLLVGRNRYEDYVNVT